MGMNIADNMSFLDRYQGLSKTMIIWCLTDIYGLSWAYQKVIYNDKSILKYLEGFLYQKFPHHYSITHNEGWIDHEKGSVNLTIHSVQTNKLVHTGQQTHSWFIYRKAPKIIEK